MKQLAPAARVASRKNIVANEKELRSVDVLCYQRNITLQQANNKIKKSRIDFNAETVVELKSLPQPRYYTYYSSLITIVL